jgi:hypothetical protein
MMKRRCPALQFSCRLKMRIQPFCSVLVAPLARHRFLIYFGQSLKRILSQHEPPSRVDILAMPFPKFVDRHSSQCQ